MRREGWVHIDPRDVATPQLQRLLELARQQARSNASISETALQSFVFDECERLGTAGREALENEFYVP